MMSIETFLQDIYRRKGVSATFVSASGGTAEPIRIRFEYAGQIDVEHGSQERALVKVLWADFPDGPPNGVFVVDGQEWKTEEVAGKADGHREGLQRAVLCVGNRRFEVRK